MCSDLTTFLRRMHGSYCDDDLKWRHFIYFIAAYNRRSKGPKNTPTRYWGQRCTPRNSFKSNAFSSPVLSRPFQFYCLSYHSSYDKSLTIRAARYLSYCTLLHPSFRILQTATTVVWASSHSTTYSGRVEISTRYIITRTASHPRIRSDWWYLARVIIHHTCPRWRRLQQQ